MSAYQTFADLASALVAFGADPKQCRRHVEIDGHVIDLVQAKEDACRFGKRPMDDAELRIARGLNMIASDAAAWDEAVAANVRAELARASEVLPELAVPEVAPDASAYRCPWCSRPWDGAK